LAAFILLSFVLSPARSATSAIRLCGTLIIKPAGFTI
jgi:hypothetical protein